MVESLVEMLQGDGRSCAWNSFQFVSRHWCCGRQATSRCVAHIEAVSVSDVANDPMLPGVDPEHRPFETPWLIILDLDFRHEMPETRTPTC